MNKICNRFRRPGQRLINAIQKQTNFCNTYFANNRWFDIFFRIQKRSRNRNRVKRQTVEQISSKKSLNRLYFAHPHQHQWVLADEPGDVALSVLEGLARGREL